MSELFITPLGTVSPYLKEDRNCPGFLVEYKDKKILLDCGNGITKLLNFPEDLKNLTVIITHYHKDHFGDLGSIQYASYVYHNLGMLEDNVKVMLPKNDIAFQKESIISNQESYCEYVKINQGDSFYIDDLKITFEDNYSHTIESFMVKLEGKDLKVVYTSDIGTTNFDSLVEFCKNSNVIICESSFLKKHHSSSTTHMTAWDAGRLAKLSNAKKLLLTHLWPEEDRTLYLKEAKQIFEHTELAEEGKRIMIREEL